MSWFRCILIGIMLCHISLAPASPFVGPSKLETIKLLKSSRIKQNLPITLGTNDPEAVIDFNGVLWTLKPLVRNMTKQNKITKKQQDEGYYMPEHDFAALEPGKAILSEKDKLVFIKKIQALNWIY